jgi:hypothetical protein
VAKVPADPAGSRGGTLLFPARLGKNPHLAFSMIIFGKASKNLYYWQEYPNRDALTEHCCLS